MSTYQLINADCVQAMANMPEASVDAIVTDPPYELGFMGKSWDASGIAYSVEMWRQALRVLKPGGHLLAFSGSRTYHRMTCAIEDAGFEVRDQIMWVYGSGFPKSLDVSKAIDKLAGAEREVIGTKKAVPGVAFSSIGPTELEITAPATDAARQWQGWGTALKPAHEPICVARKPLVGTVAANVLAHVTGALNIDGCRVGTDGGTRAVNFATKNDGRLQRWDEGYRGARNEIETLNMGRWPANLIHDGSEEVTDRLGEPSRFFYCAKASKADRDAGLDGFEEKPAPASSGNRLERMGSKSGPRANIHPTVKPTDLMRYLCRLVTPPGGTVLDPFTGSGSTGRAALLEGFNFIGCELSPEYIAIADARIKYAMQSNEPANDNRTQDLFSVVA